MQVPPGRTCRLLLLADDEAAAEIMALGLYITRLSGASELTRLEGEEQAPRGAVSAVGRRAQLFIPLTDLVDIARERQRVEAAMEKLRADIAHSQAKLNNRGFTDKAPAAVVEKERQTLSENEEKLERLVARFKSIALAEE